MKHLFAATVAVVFVLPPFAHGLVVFQDDFEGFDHFAGVPPRSRPSAGGKAPPAT